MITKFIYGINWRTCVAVKYILLRFHGDSSRFYKTYFFRITNVNNIRLYVYICPAMIKLHYFISTYYFLEYWSWPCTSADIVICLCSRGVSYLIRTAKTVNIINRIRSVFLNNYVEIVFIRGFCYFFGLWLTKWCENVAIREFDIINLILEDHNVCHGIESSKLE